VVESDDADLTVMRRDREHADEPASLQRRGATLRTDLNADAVRVRQEVQGWIDLPLEINKKPDVHLLFFLSPPSKEIDTIPAAFDSMLKY